MSAAGSGENALPPTLGDLGRAIGRYTESEGGDSAETLAAHRGLFAIYDRWVDAGRPEIDTVALSLTDEQVHAVLARRIANDAKALRTEATVFGSSEQVDP